MKNQNLDTITSIITPYLREYPISYAGVFGSYARGDFRSDSDIDILIRYSTPPDLFQFGGLLNKLEKATGKKVDLVIESTLHPLMKKYINKDLIHIYEWRQNSIRVRDWGYATRTVEVVQ